MRFRRSSESLPDGRMPVRGNAGVPPPLTLRGNIRGLHSRSRRVRREQNANFFNGHNMTTHDTLLQ